MRDGVTVGVPERVLVIVGVRDFDCEIVGVLDGVREGLVVLERVALGVTVRDFDCEIVGVLEGVPEGDGVTVRVRVPDGVSVPD